MFYDIILLNWTGTDSDHIIDAYNLGKAINSITTGEIISFYNYLDNEYIIKFVNIIGITIS